MTWKSWTTDLCPVWASVLLVLAAVSLEAEEEVAGEGRVERLLRSMTLEEKVGQMSLRGGGSSSKRDPLDHLDTVRAGGAGALINVMDPAAVDRLQRAAVEESRLGIPLLFGRDVIHGFRTVFPIPLGQAAAWNPDLVEKGARIAAREASTFGVNWTFAPMVDITRDPRWGRIAESLGEDPYLASLLGVAMVRGFQGEDLTRADSLAACAKHFAAYGAAEGGRDYDSAQVGPNLLRNLYLRPFHAAAEAGVASYMTAFNEIDGVPATAHPGLLRSILREDWGAEGFVVSDWESVTEMIAHGFSADARDAARQAATAGLDMEMMSEAYSGHLAALVREGEVPEALLDEAVERILRIKERLGLFEDPYRRASRGFPLLAPESLEAAREAARQSLVLLENDGVLPLDQEGTVAVIGPLADAPHEQLGTWTFDGRKEDTRTPLAALRQVLGEEQVLHAPGLAVSRTRSREGFPEALGAARKADRILFFAGEEAILSGEAHSRADIRLPGAQEDLILELAALGKPLVLVVLAGRPITLERVLSGVDAVLVAWHPGTMGGSALADVLLGEVSPSGRLPVTWPKSVGQVPIFYNHKNTGRPPQEEKILPFDDIPAGAWQSSLSNTSHYLDLGMHPRYPFGHGLTYSRFEYRDLKVSPQVLTPGGAVEVSATVANAGRRQATEVVQLYFRDEVASLTRPVKELAGFRRVTLEPGEEERVTFQLEAEDLAFYGWDQQLVTEPGSFRVWIGWNAREGLEGRLELSGELAPAAAEH